jgi:hypothetical protein
MELRQITPLVLSEFILELQQAGVGPATIRSCLGLLQTGEHASGSRRARQSASPPSPKPPPCTPANAESAGPTTAPCPTTCATASRAC